MLASTAMFSVLFAVLTLGQPAPETAAPVASPAPTSAAISSSGSPLREIGHVRALTPFCKQVLEHANGAIDATLGNDARIAFTVANMKTIDLDSTILTKNQGTRELMQTYITLHAAAARAQAQAKQIEADAKTAPTPEQKADLTSFAQALGGAAFRQKRVADQLGNYVAFLETHPPISQFDRDQELFNLQYEQTLPGRTVRGDPRDDLTPTLSEMAKAAAQRFDESSLSILADETHASQFVEPAFGPCK